MNYRILIAAVTALSFVAIGTADAASKHKRNKARQGAAYAYVPASPYGMRTRRTSLGAAMGVLHR